MPYELMLFWNRNELIEFNALFFYRLIKQRDIWYSDFLFKNKIKKYILTSKTIINDSV